MQKGSLEHVAIETGVPDDVILKLQKMGHTVTSNIGGYDRALFGRGQVIARGNWPFNPVSAEDHDVYWAGSDPRADGTAIGY